MKILNLYAGLGGNRKLWSDEHEITAVEAVPEIARVYKRLYSTDKIVTLDAHGWLLEHHAEAEFVWSSPPCQLNTRMVKFSRHKPKGYPDLRLYEEIIYLRAFSKALWVVENVVPYYEPLIEPTAQIGRHLFWSNFPISPMEHPVAPNNFINLCNLKGKQAMMDWLGIHYPENIYYGKNHCPAQILRNCCHPEVGLHILKCAELVRPAHAARQGVTGDPPLTVCLLGIPANANQSA